MVKTENGLYNNDVEYKKNFDMFSFALSDFQKHAIQSIVNGNHCLVTAHTGSGKTVPAEFAIKYFHSKGKKVIYTTPIKALSNQKLYDLRKKYPEIEFGILTGDCKDNPDADVLIMTTEILKNTLFNKQITQNNENTQIPLHFEMDFENELAAVVFDEVHYIADEERGTVWEQSILLLPPKVQMIMLSATINQPEQFAHWIEDEKQKQGSDKEVILTSTNERVVPLTHYGWISAPNAVVKKAKGTVFESKLIDTLHQLIPLKTSDGEIKDSSYYSLSEIMKHFRKENIFVNRSFLLNKLIQYLNNNNMLPAMCFVFSRKKVEECAKEINLTLFEKDSDIPNKISQECKKILIDKLPNYKEYIELEEYKNILSLLQKGVAIHHAGVMPVLREMIEMLFEKGYIKVLFATETFAVGINMPTKTVVFSSLTKWNGSQMRQLYPNEYTQMAGRAGRRGIDTVGHVIHCNNLFELPEFNEYKKILAGAPKSIKSQFKISYNIILNIIATSVEKENDTIMSRLMEFMNKSMIQTELDNEIKGYYYEIKEIENKIIESNNSLSHFNIPNEEMKTYFDLQEKLPSLKKNQQKKGRKQLKGLEDKYKKLQECWNIKHEINNLDQDINYLTNCIKNAKNYIFMNIENVLNILENNKLIIKTDNKINLTTKGIIATHVQELHCLAIADIYESTNGFSNFSVKQLVGLFSCFTNITVSEEFAALVPKTYDANLQYIILDVKKQYDYYYDLEQEYNIDSGIEYKLHFELVDQLMEWCDCETEEECKIVINDIKENKGVFLGEFVKAILKINNIVTEFEKICEILNNMSLLNKIKQISACTMKYIVTNQSLYI
jgi:superfamily II RNA helicase